MSNTAHAFANGKALIPFITCAAIARYRGEDLHE